VIKLRRGDSPTYCASPNSVPGWLRDLSDNDAQPWRSREAAARAPAELRECARSWRRWTRTESAASPNARTRGRHAGGGASIRPAPPVRCAARGEIWAGRCSATLPLRGGDEKRARPGRRRAGLDSSSDAWARRGRMVGRRGRPVARASCRALLAETRSAIPGSRESRRARLRAPHHSALAAHTLRRSAPLPVVSVAQCHCSSASVCSRCGTACHARRAWRSRAPPARVRVHPHRNPVPAAGVILTGRDGVLLVRRRFDPAAGACVSPRAS